MRRTRRHARQTELTIEGHSTPLACVLLFSVCAVCVCADIWSTGQDAVASIKRQLQRLVPDIRVFLE